MNSTATQHSGSRFETVVARVDAYPLAVTILVWLLIAQSALYAGIALAGQTIVEGVNTGDAHRELGVMIGGRSIALVILTVIALQSKHVRFLQLVIGVRAVIEMFDIIAGMQHDPVSGNVPLAVIKAVVQLALFVYVGAIASGHIARYRPASVST